MVIHVDGRWPWWLVPTLVTVVVKLMVVVHAAVATVVCGQNTEGGKEQKKKEKYFRRRVGADTLVLEDLVVIIDASTDGAGGGVRSEKVKRKYLLTRGHIGINALGKGAGCHSARSRPYVVLLKGDDHQCSRCKEKRKTYLKTGALA